MIKSKFLDKILSGEKTTTIRLGKVDVKSREFLIHSGGKIIAKAVLDKVFYKRIRDLNDDDARKDGFKNRDALLRELKNFYGQVSEDDIVTIIQFKITEILDKPEGRYPSDLTPYEIAKLALEHLNLSDYERSILQTLVKTKSLRKTAKKHFGSIGKRWKVRRILEFALSELAKRGIIEITK